jgi:hypothetical protein
MDIRFTVMPLEVKQDSYLFSLLLSPTYGAPFFSFVLAFYSCHITLPVPFYQGKSRLWETLCSKMAGRGRMDGISTATGLAAFLVSDKNFRAGAYRISYKEHGSCN